MFVATDVQCTGYRLVVMADPVNKLCEAWLGDLSTSVVVVSSESMYAVHHTFLVAFFVPIKIMIINKVGFVVAYIHNYSY